MLLNIRPPICLSAHVNCSKMADWIQMLFWVVSGVGRENLTIFPYAESTVALFGRMTEKITATFPVTVINACLANDA